MRTLQLLTLAIIVLLFALGCGRHRALELDGASAERIGDYVEITAEIRCIPLGYDECFREIEEPDRICVEGTWLDRDEQTVTTGELCRNLRLFDGETETFTFRSDDPVLESDLTIEVRLTSELIHARNSPIVISSPDPEDPPESSANTEEGNSVEGNSDSLD